MIAMPSTMVTTASPTENVKDDWNCGSASTTPPSPVAQRPYRRLAQFGGRANSRDLTALQFDEAVLDHFVAGAGQHTPAQERVLRLLVEHRFDNLLVPPGRWFSHFNLLKMMLREWYIAIERG